MTGKGSHTVNGDAGIDTLYFDTVSVNAKVTKGIVTVTALQRATLDSIERVQFKDKYVVLDLEPGTSGNKAALLAYTLKGSAGLKDADLVAKTLLPLFDSGFSMADVSSYLIDSGYLAGLAGGTSNAQFVSTLFKAVVGVVPDSATVATFESLITSGAYTQATFLSGVAQLELVGTSINFSQYASTGLQMTL